MTAQETLQAHLAAIDARDLTAYDATLHDEVVVVLPNGSRLEGREAVTGFHRDWFADLDWTQKLTPLSVVETPGTLVATYEADYHDVDPQGAPIHARNVLSMVFTHGDGGWKLLHDQNTRLP